MASLESVQSEFQAAVLTGEDAVLVRLADGPVERRDRMLQVYRDAYVLRLVEVVQNDHPALYSYLGAGAFDTLARSYVARHPSCSRNARWFPSRLSEFLGETEPYRDHRQLVDLAMIETALADAFDAADGPVLSASDVVSVPSDRWGRLRFTLHPSVRRFAVTSNALAIWQALRREDDPPAPEVGLYQGRAILVWRRELTPMIREMDPIEAEALHAIAGGRTFEEMCERVGVLGSPETASPLAATLLSEWLRAGVLSTAIIAPAPILSTSTDPVVS